MPCNREGDRDGIYLVLCRDREATTTAPSTASHLDGRGVIFEPREFRGHAPPAGNCFGENFVTSTGSVPGRERCLDGGPNSAGLVQSTSPHANLMTATPRNLDDARLPATSARLRCRHSWIVMTFRERPCGRCPSTRHGPRGPGKVQRSLPFLLVRLRPATAFGLVDLPSEEAAEAVHRESHGDVANKIIQVDPARVGDLLGRFPEVPAGQPYVESAFRGILSSLTWSVPPL